MKACPPVLTPLRVTLLADAPFPITINQEATTSTRKHYNFNSLTGIRTEQHCAPCHACMQSAGSMQQHSEGCWTLSCS